MVITREISVDVAKRNVFSAIVAKQLDNNSRFLKVTITNDKVWLQSMTEIFGSNNNGIAEGSQLAYWVGASDADRIKYEGTTARYWWLRSPYPAVAHGVRSVYTSGVLNYNIASYAHGVVPACCII